MMPACHEFVDWDFFWRRVEKHPLFLKLLYRVHLRYYKKILLPISLNNPKMLELGAGTGQASIYIKQIYGGNLTLIDNNPFAYKMHRKLFKDVPEINYITKDFFDVGAQPIYDLVISDGLLEHFSDKMNLVLLHKSFAKTNGYILIFALGDNLLSRFLALGEKKMGYSQPINLGHCIKLCEKCGLEMVHTHIVEPFCRVLRPPAIYRVFLAAQTTIGFNAVCLVHNCSTTCARALEIVNVAKSFFEYGILCMKK